MLLSLQACRALAALMVVFFHAGGALAHEKYFNLPWIARPFSFGHAGVEFFFVLSGFIIFHAHRDDLGEPARLASYLRKRVVRIYPAYAVIFALAAAAAWALPSTRAAVPTDPAVLLKALLLLPQDPARVGGTGAPVIIVAWSLHYELLFYAVFGCFIAGRWLGGAALAALATVALGCAVAGSCGFPSSFVTSQYLLLFAFGAVVAQRSRRPLAPARARTFAVAGAVGFAAMALTEVALFPGQKTAWTSLTYGAASTLLIHGLVGLERNGQVFGRSPAMQHLGAASYVLYLIHYPLVSGLCKLAIAAGLRGAAGAGFALLLTVTVCVLAASLFHRAVERPLIARLTPRRVPPAPSVPTA